MDVARIDVAQAVSQADLPRAGEYAERRRRLVQHLEVGMEGGEVQWHVRAELTMDPARERIDLRVGIVLAGDQQGGDLQPDRRLVPQVLQRVQDGVEVPETEAAIEVLGEPLQVDVR